MSLRRDRVAGSASLSRLANCTGIDCGFDEGVPLVRWDPGGLEELGFGERVAGLFEGADDGFGRRRAVERRWLRPEVRLSLELVERSFCDI